MENTKEIEKIKCPIFQTKNRTIERITKTINETENVGQKAAAAQKLLNEVEDLLSCESFSQEKAECKICQYIANLRKETANLIIKAVALKPKT